MKAEIKLKWLEALRSGKYKQGQAALRVGNTFCCLGVLCDIHSKETGMEWGGDEEGTGAYFEQQDVLPQVVIDWAGLEDSNPTINFDASDEDVSLAYESLAELNDSGAVDFNVIADVIEAQL